MNFLSYFITLYLLCFCFTTNGKTIEKVLATVNGEMITLLELKETRKRIKSGLMDHFTILSLFKKSELRKNNQKMLKVLIYEKLIDDAIDQLETKPQISDAQMQEELKNRRKQSGLSRRAFSKRLVRNNFTASSYKNFLKKELLRKQLVQMEVLEKVRISDQDLNDYAIKTQGKPLFSSFEYELVYLLFPPTKNGREMAYKTHKSLSTDSELFDKWNTKGTGKVKKESLGKKSLSAIHPSIRNNIKDLSIGQYSAVLSLPTGYHIFKLLWKAPIVTNKNQRRKQKLFSQLSAKLFKDELQNWLNNKQENAFIQNHS